MTSVLCLVSHYLPGFKAGGPLRSISNIVSAVGDQCDFLIITSDRDLGDSCPYDSVEINAWVKVGNAKVFYSKKALPTIKEVMEGVDVIYLNSFFDRYFSIAPVFIWNFSLKKQRRLIIAPRGEFSEGALSIKKYRKILYIGLAKFLGLYRGVVWHASTDLEVQDIIRTLGVSPGKIRVAQDVSNLKSPSHEKNDSVDVLAPKTPLRICFISRISRKKNLDFALKVLQSVTVSVVFDVYGPPEDENYFSLCRDLAEKMPANIVVNFRGPLNHDHVYMMFKQHHLFFLPTLGENYGHVIAEALSAGTPVLLSDQTPWVNLQTRGVGWSLPLCEEDGFVQAIHHVASMEENTYNRMRVEASQYSLGHDHAAVEHDMFKLLLE